jgi:cyclophilin family peptidyl-prolyl cis-trans isomerase
MIMRVFLRFILAVAVTLGIAFSMAGPAAAQGAPPSKDDLKAPAELPKMAPAPTILGMVNNVDDENVLVLDLSTGGRVKIVLRPDVAPKTVERVKILARQGFYDGTIFHRVIDAFMAQGGDPTGTGQGGSKLPNLEPEFNDLPHVRGAVSMARAQAENSANSQFFIVFQPVLKLDRLYTVFGRVIEGMQYVDAIARGEPPENPSRILKASIAADHVPPPPPQTPIPAAATTQGLKSLGLPGLNLGTAPPPKL